jgi:replicative DNA helicase
MNHLARESTILSGGLPVNDTPTLARLGDLLGDWQADAEAAYDARQSGTARGPVTGLAEVDMVLGGCLAPGVTVLSGNTGVGKTALGLQMATDCGAACLYVTAEMRPLELLRRVTARVTSTYLGRLKSGEFTPAASLALARQAVEYAPWLSIADATQAPALPGWIRESAEIARQGRAYLLVIIDSAHSWIEGFAEGASEYDALNLGLAELRKLAAGLDCSVLAIAEQNRASMRAGKAGDVNAMAGSRKFEYGAEAVLDLHRKQGAQEDAAGEVEVTATLAKNRNGAAGRPVHLLFNGTLQRFR